MKASLGGGESSYETEVGDDHWQIYVKPLTETILGVSITISFAGIRNEPRDSRRARMNRGNRT